MQTIYQDETTEAVILVDASNAFNSIKRNVFLHNISIICPSISTYVHNCYSVHSRLFIVGGGELKSTEGTTQGDLIMTAVHTIDIYTLILMMVEFTNKTDSTIKTAAYADDITIAGELVQLKYWWNRLCGLGPKFGYYPEASKSWLIMKETVKHEASTIFKGMKKESL